MQTAAERAAEEHLDDLTDQLEETRQHHQITRRILDRRLHLPLGTTRQRELGLCYGALPLTEFAAWSRVLGLTIHLTDQYGRVLPSWMPHRPPHETEPAFEAQRLTRNLDLHRDTIPCDLSVLADHLDITPTTWQDWNTAATHPDVLSIARACIALDVRVTLIPLWHEYTLTELRTLQSDSQWSPTSALTGSNQPSLPAERPAP